MKKTKTAGQILDDLDKAGKITITHRFHDPSGSIAEGINATNQKALFGPDSNHETSWRIAASLRCLQMLRAQNKNGKLNGVIASMESSTAPELLDAAMQGRLSQIAKTHAGLVKGRYKRQWRTLIVVRSYLEAARLNRFPTVLEVWEKYDVAKAALESAGELNGATVKEVWTLEQLRKMLNIYGLKTTREKAGRLPDAERKRRRLMRK